jgi:hypothetical protein
MSQKSMSEFCMSYSLITMTSGIWDIGQHFEKNVTFFRDRRAGRIGCLHDFTIT